MRKETIAALGVMLAAVPAMAEGYQINSISAKQLGMGHTGVAQKLGAESMYFNPAGLGFMQETLDLSGSVAFIMPTATATVGGKEYTTDCGVSTPLGVHAAFSITPKIKAGVSFYTPYGSSINWTDNWPGAVLSQNVSLKVFTVQPTVAWAITDNLSIGAGAMISWGSVDLNKGLIPASTMDALINTYKAAGYLPAETPTFGDTTPASVNLNGTAQVTAGVNVGAMWTINEHWTVGASWRSQMNMKVKAGDASVTYASSNEAIRTLLASKLDILNSSNFTAQMPCPWVFGFGATYKPISTVTIAADARLTGWHAYKTLDIEFLSEQLSGYDQHITKDYHNSWCVSLGAQWTVTRRFDARIGMMIDTTPVNKQYYNPETPGMTKIEPTIGLSFRPVKGLSVDLAFMYVAGLGEKGASCEYTDMLTGQATKFTADYKLHALTPAIGVSYRF